MKKQFHDSKLLIKYLFIALYKYKIKLKNRLY